MRRYALPILLVVLLGIGCRGRREADGRAMRSYSAPDPDQAGAELERLGGKVKVERDAAGRNPVVTIDLEEKRIRDADLKHLEAFADKPILLDLSGTAVGDEGLVHLRGLSRLRWLRLRGTPVSDAGLLQLEGLEHLSFLDLHGTRVDDAGMAHLRGLTRLRTLDVGGTRVTNAGIKDLKKALPKVEISR